MIKSKSTDIQSNIPSSYHCQIRVNSIESIKRDIAFEMLGRY